jgi:hypothetical protein
MRAPVLLVLLILASTLFALETPISTPDIVPTTLWPANQPEVAAGDGYLAVWSETHGYYTGEIKLRTWDLDGTPRQFLPASIGFGTRPHAFWNGEVFVIVYAVSIGRFGSPEPIPAIVAKHIRPDGTLVEGSERTILMARFGGAMHALAWNGTNALIAIWVENNYKLIQLDRDGAPVNETPVGYHVPDIAVKPGGEFFVLNTSDGGAVAVSPDRVVILKMENFKAGGTRAVIRDHAGNVLEELVLVSSGTLGSIVWDGSAFVVAYTDYSQICAARFTSAADLTHSCASGVSASHPAIAIGPRGPFRAWKDGSQIQTDAGLASTEYSVATIGDAVVDERGLVTAWVESTGHQTHQIRVGGINHDGTLRPEYSVDTTWPFYPVQLARGATRTLLVWAAPDFSIRAVPLDPDGTPPNGSIHFRNGSSPDVAARGDDFAIVWAASHGLESIVLRPDGVGDLQQFGDGTFNSGQSEPAITATPDGYLVVWREATAHGFARIVAEPLDAQGKRYRGGNRLLDVQGTTIEYPRVACNSQKCIVTWFGNAGELWYTFVNFDGERLAGDRVMKVDAMTRDLVIKPASDGSFAIYRSGTVTRIDASGVAGATQVWSTQRITLGNVVDVRGRPTAVYARGAFDGYDPSRIYAFEFIPRTRTVRH